MNEGFRSLGFAILLMPFGLLYFAVHYNLIGLIWGVNFSVLGIGFLTNYFIEQNKRNKPMEVEENGI